MKILLAVSHNRSDVNVLFMHSLFRMLNFTQRYHEAHLMFYDYYDVCSMRTQACEQAIKEKFDYVFFIDSDMVYPEDSVLRLLKHNKELCSGFYTMRREPLKPVHFKEISFDGMNKDGNHLIPDGTLQTQAAGGFGGVLVKTEVLKKMGFPWFKFLYNEKTHDHLGEDIFFFQRAKDFGYTSYVDTSLHYGHIINGLIYYDKKVNVV